METVSLDEHVESNSLLRNVHQEKESSNRETVEKIDS